MMFRKFDENDRYTYPECNKPTMAIVDSVSSPTRLQIIRTMFKMEDNKVQVSDILNDTLVDISKIHAWSYC